MSTRDLEYGHPADDWARYVPATVTAGVMATGYGPERLMNDNPAYPFKTDTTTFRLVWDFGTPVFVAYVLLVHHNFAPGLVGVQWQLGTGPDTGQYTKPFTIRPYTADGFPRNEAVDLRPDSPLAYRYGALQVGIPNTVPCAVGQIAILGTVRHLTGTLMIDAEDDERFPLIEHKTDAGVSTIYAYGTRQRWIRGTKIQTEGDALAIRAWNRATAGRALPFTLIPHVFTDTTPANEESWIVRWEDDHLPRTYIDSTLQSRFVLRFEEVARGLRPTPAAV